MNAGAIQKQGMTSEKGILNNKMDFDNDLNCSGLSIDKLSYHSPEIKNDKQQLILIDLQILKI